MADEEYFEIPGDGGHYPNKEAAVTSARRMASSTDSPIQVYKVKRTLVKTVQRTVTVQETDVPTA